MKIHTNICLPDLSALTAVSDRGTRGQVRPSEKAGVSGLILEPTDNNNNQLLVNVREQQQSLRQPGLQFQPRAHSGLSPDVGGPASQFSNNA